MGYYGQGWRCGAERGDIRVKNGGVELRGGILGAKREGGS